MRCRPDLPRSLRAALHGRVELCQVELLPGNQTDLGHPGQKRRICGGRRGRTAHQTRHHVEIRGGIHVENHRLRSVGHAEARIRINRGRLVRVGFTVCAERHNRVLSLQRIDGCIVLVGAVGVSPPQDHHIARGALDLFQSGWHFARPTRSGDQVDGRGAAGGAGAGRIEIRHPEIGHLEKVEALAHLRVTEHLWLGEIEPRHRIEGIGIRRRTPRKFAGG